MRYPWLRSAPSGALRKPSSTRPALTSSKYRPRFELLEDRAVPAFLVLLQQPGFPDLTIADNDGNDSNGTVGSIRFMGTYGNFNVGISLAFSHSARASTTSSEMDIAMTVATFNPTG